MSTSPHGSDSYGSEAGSAEGESGTIYASGESDTDYYEPTSSSNYFNRAAVISCAVTIPGTRGTRPIMRYLATPMVTNDQKLKLNHAGCKLLALIDTGSEISLVSTRAMESLLKKGCAVSIPSKGVTIIGIGGVTKTHSAIKIRLEIGTRKNGTLVVINLECEAHDDVQYDLTIGCDTLGKYGAAIHSDTKKLNLFVHGSILERNFESEATLNEIGKTMNETEPHPRLKTENDSCANNTKQELVITEQELVIAEQEFVITEQKLVQINWELVLHELRQRKAKPDELAESSTSCYAATPTDANSVEGEQDTFSTEKYGTEEDATETDSDAHRVSIENDDTVRSDSDLDSDYHGKSMTTSDASESPTQPDMSLSPEAPNVSVVGENDRHVIVDEASNDPPTEWSVNNADETARMFVEELVCLHSKEPLQFGDDDTTNVINDIIVEMRRFSFPLYQKVVMSANTEIEVLRILHDLWRMSYERIEAFYDTNAESAVIMESKAQQHEDYCTTVLELMVHLRHQPNFLKLDDFWNPIKEPWKALNDRANGTGSDKFSARTIIDFVQDNWMSKTGEYPGRKMRRGRRSREARLHRQDRVYRRAGRTDRFYRKKILLIKDIR